MFEKLTPRLDRVIKLSQRIARDYGQDYVGTEHLLLAILEEGTGEGVDILRGFDADLPKTKGIIDKLVKGSLEDTWVFGRLPGTPHFRNVMSAAIEQARQLESRFICTEHLLLALAKEPGSVAHSALAELGIDAPAIQEEIIKRLDHPPKQAGTPGSGS
ncbi:MAG TPA: Clp protease N-terminal domain-containing protein [Phycisphaerae bacterium]|nr:Clp protease N-terminal domain-containing protein [Phycisphaerae bacterium]